jgi:putative phosphoribosyl transferase
MEVFEDRRDAGRRLAAALADHPSVQAAERVVVLAVPRGGLPVAIEVAGALGADWDVVVVRKLRSPHNPELGFGAIGSDGHVDINTDLTERIRISSEQIDAEVENRRGEVARRLELYRSVRPPAEIAGATVIVTDDGIATGGTIREACALARRQGAARIVLAAPVGPPGIEETLAEAADDIVVLSQPAEFLAVGQAYRDFAQLDDAAITQLLREAT